jgi:hypothetical protein
MGLFGKSKQSKQKDQIEALMGEVGRDMDLGQKVAQKQMADMGLDMGTVMGAASQAMAPGVMEQMQAYAARMMRLNTAGVEAPATLRSVSLGEPSPMLGGIPVQLGLTVLMPGAAPYDVSTDQVLQAAMADTLAAGQSVTVKVDPADSQCVMLWGGAIAAAQPAQAAAPAPAAQADDRIERIAKLHELHKSGVLTDAEFEAQKAKLLAG